MNHFPDTIALHPDTRTSARTCCEHYGVACGQGRQCPQRMAAEAATDIGAEPCGKHRTSWLIRAWLRLVRAMT